MCLSCCVATGKFRLAQFRQQKAPVPCAAQGGEEAADAIRRSLFRPQNDAMGWPVASFTVCESGRIALKTFDQSFARMTFFFWLHVAISPASRTRSPALFGFDGLRQFDRIITARSCVSLWCGKEENNAGCNGTSKRAHTSRSGGEGHYIILFTGPCFVGSRSHLCG